MIGVLYHLLPKMSKKLFICIMSIFAYFYIVWQFIFIFYYICITVLLRFCNITFFPWHNFLLLFFLHHEVLLLCLLLLLFYYYLLLQFFLLLLKDLQSLSEFLQEMMQNLLRAAIIASKKLWHAPANITISLSGLCAFLTSITEFIKYLEFL